MYRHAILVPIFFVLTASTSALSVSADISGFSGYAFGAGYDYILEDMRSEGYKPVELIDRTQWYRGELEGYRTEFDYVFNGGLLVSGMWNFDDTSQSSFRNIEELLNRTYSSSVIRTTRDGVVIREHHGPDARIVHVLDSARIRHTVHYYLVEDLVAEQATHR